MKTCINEKDKITKATVREHAFPWDTCCEFYHYYYYFLILHQSGRMLTVCMVFVRTLDAEEKIIRAQDDRLKTLSGINDYNTEPLVMNIYQGKDN